MIAVNLFGAPGAGKSTLAHLLTGLLKKCHVPCELASEYAKDLVLDRSEHFFANQFRILGEQSWRSERVAASGAECVVTDSPLALIGFFSTRLYPERYSETFAGLVLDAHREWNGADFFIERNHPYESRGRVQTEAEADLMSVEMLAWLRGRGIEPQVLRATDVLAERVFCELVASRRVSIPALGRRSAMRAVSVLLASRESPDDERAALAAAAKLSESETP